MKGYLRKRGKSWSYTVDIGRDPITNKRKQKSRGGFKTKKEAHSALAKIISEYEQGEYVEDNKIMLKTFMRDYIESYVKKTLRPATVINYEKALEKHIEPYFKEKRINDIKPIHIQKFYTHVIEDKKLSHGTLKNIHSCLKKTMDAAERWMLIKKNPCVIPVPKSDSKAENVWSLEEAFEFLTIAEKHSYYYIIYLLTLFTGMRRGEVLGLPVHNVDFNANEIKIDQQLLIDNKSKPYLTTDLKNKTSYRTLAVPDNVMASLQKYMHEKKKYLFENGISNRHNLVFVSIYGNPIHPNGINKDFRLLLQAHKLKPITFHGLRHTHATILADQNESVHAIQDRLGHSSPTITNETYIHLTPKMKQNLMVNLNELFEEKTKKES